MQVLALVTTDLMQSVAFLFGCCCCTVDLMQSIILLGAPNLMQLGHLIIDNQYIVETVLI